MPRHKEGSPKRPSTGARRCTSFVAPHEPAGKAVRHLHGEGKPAHGVRVGHDADTLLMHLSGEDGEGWTTIAIDRVTRALTVAQGVQQTDTAREAREGLYGAEAPGDR